MNALYYGDNLAVLRESIADESVDLIYLDPEQVKRFIETAKALEADESEGAFEKAFSKVVTPSRLALVPEYGKRATPSDGNSGDPPLSLSMGSDSCN